MTFGDFNLQNARGTNLTATIPVLPSSDLAATAGLYEALGFTSTLIAEGGGYLILRKEWVELHFWRHPALDPAANAASVFLRVADVDAAIMPFAALGPIAVGCRFHPVEDKPWGMRQGSFVDHDGNLLQIGSPIGHARLNNQI